MFHFISVADKVNIIDVQASTEDEQGENLYNKNLDNESLEENDDISTDYKYLNIPREIEVISMLRGV